ncbi:MAG: hypothetical protein O7F76_01525, partial [Planctomycetota bacterium]|nr:hypothetical protein [Planctomycetota bacterium]
MTRNESSPGVRDGTATWTLRATRLYTRRRCALALLLALARISAFFLISLIPALYGLGPIALAASGLFLIQIGVTGYRQFADLRRFH